MVVRKASTDDIDELIRLRIAYLNEQKSPMPPPEEEDLSQKLNAYFLKYMQNGGFTAFFAEENGEVISTAFLSVIERPPRSVFSSSLFGTVYNVFTYKEHRRKGAATKVMTALMEEARRLGVAAIDLLATKEGKRLYEKLGFGIVSDYDFMRIKIKG